MYSQRIAIHTIKSKIYIYSFLFLISFVSNAHAHGGVFLEDDLCFIQIDFYKAHFTIYQPQTSQHKEFCEDIPSVTESIFVMEYLHDGLRKAPIDFRIIKDVLNLGRFFKEEDLDKIDNIENVTVFYQEPQIFQDGILLAKYQFQVEGDYVGIINADIPDSDTPYIAVFPFRVGSKDLGYIPILIAVVILLQLNFWLLDGGYSRILRKFKKIH